MNEKRQSRFVLCVRNEDADDLEALKVYQVLPDREAALENHLRVIDESGEDYLYPADYFVPVRLPVAAVRALASLVKPARRFAASAGHRVPRQRAGRN